MVYFLGAEHLRIFDHLAVGASAEGSLTVAAVITCDGVDACGDLADFDHLVVEFGAEAFTAAEEVGGC